MKKPIETYARHEGLPPKAVAGQACAIDLEMFKLKKRQLHRPHGKLAFATFTLDGHNVYVVRKESDIEKAMDRVDKATIVFQNGDFDMRHIRRWTELEPRPPELIADTFITDRHLYNGWYERFSLDDLSRRHLGKPLDKSTRKLFAEDSEVVTEEMLDYGCIDDVRTYDIHAKQQTLITDKERKLWAEVDAPALWAVLDFRGIPIDMQAWRELAKYNEEQAKRIRARLMFNPSSGPQVMAALSNKRIYVDNTREQTLEHFKHAKIVQDILAYRNFAKRASTYGEKYLEEYVEEDGLIYPDFVLIGAETHRMSSRSPNAQNIPREKEFRQCFRVADDEEMVIADYSAQEPHILAQLSGDEALKAVFAEGRDIHMEVARVIYHNPNLVRGTEEGEAARQRGKVINLAVDYGMTVNGLAKTLGISRQEAQQLLNNYFSTYFDVGVWLQEQRGIAYEQGYVETLAGGIIWINPYKYGWQNNAVNGPVQGSASHMTKYTLGRIHRPYVKAGAKARAKFPICLVVHDEITGVAKKGKGSQYLGGLIERSMIRGFEKYCPDVSSNKCADIHFGRSWADK